MLSERYLIVCYPFFLAVLAAVPWGRAASKGGQAIQLVALCLMAFSLKQHYFNPDFGNAEWNRVGDLISNSSFKSAPVCVNPSYNNFVLGYYLPRSTTILPVDGGSFAAESEKKMLDSLDASQPGIWLVEAGNADSLREHFLATSEKHRVHLRLEKLFLRENGIRVFYFEKD